MKKISVWILHLFHIEENEAKLLAFTGLYSFIMGACLGYLTIIPLAIFLVHFNSMTLPYVYIAVAILSLAIGGMYTYLEKYDSFNLSRLLVSMVIFSVIMLLLFRVLLYFSNANWIAMCLMIVGWGVLFTMGTLIISCLLNVLFTLQQGKRLYGIIAAKLGLGGVVAGFSVPLLNSVIGIKNILLFVAVLYVFVLLVLLEIRKNFSKRFKMNAAHRHVRRRDLPGHSPSLIKDSYSAYLFLFTVFSIFMFYSIDILFNHTASQHYYTAASLANFFGIFFAITDVLNLVVGLFLFRYLLNKLGIIVSLMIVPLVQIVITFSIISLSIIPPQLAALFFLIIFMKLIDKAYRHSIQSESFLLLFQPLDPRQRISTQIKNQMVVTPLATLIISVGLILFNQQYGINSYDYAIFIGFFAFICLIILYPLKKRYVSSLIDSLAKRGFPRSEIIYDKVSITLLKKYLKISTGEVILYILDLIEKIRPTLYIKSISNMLTHPIIEVRQYALEKLGQYHIVSARDKIKQMIEFDDSFKIKRNALVALALVGNQDDLQMIQKLIDSADAEAAHYAIEALLKQPNQSYQIKAQLKLQGIAISNSVTERTAAAIIIWHLKSGFQNSVLIPLLSDPDTQVRYYACLAACVIHHSDLVPFVLTNVEVLPISRMAQAALIAQGEPSVPYILKQFDSMSLEGQQGLVRVLGSIQLKVAKDLLFQRLLAFPIKLRQTILQTFTIQKWTATHEYERVLVDKYLAHELNALNALIRIAKSIVIDHATILLRSAIKREIQLNQERILYLLSFHYSHHIIMRVHSVAFLDDDDLLSYAKELLSVTLIKHHRDHILEALTYQSLDTNTAVTIESLEVDFFDSLNTVFSAPANTYLAITYAASIYAVVQLGLKQYNKEIFSLLNSDHQLIRETSVWAIEKNA